MLSIGVPERLAARQLSSLRAAGVLRACAHVKFKGAVEVCELASRGLAAGGIHSYMVCLALGYVGRLVRASSARSPRLEVIGIVVGGRPTSFMERI